MIGGNVLNNGYRKLLLPFAIVALILVIGGIILFNKTASRIKLEEENKLEAIARLKTEDIEHWIIERKGDISTFSSNNCILKQIESQFQSGRLIQNENLSSLFRTMCKSYNYKSISLHDNNKNELFIILNPSKNIKCTYDQHPNYSDTIKNIKPNVVDIYYYHCSLCNSVHLEFHSVLFYNHKRLGWITFTIDPQEYLLPYIETWPAKSSSAENLIVRREGDSVVFLNQLRHKKNKAINYRLSLVNKNVPAVMAVNGKRGIVEGDDYRQEKVIAYISEIKGTNWYMISKIDKREIYTPVRKFAFIIFGTVFIVLMGLTGVFVLFLQHDQKKYLNEIYKANQERFALIENFDLFAKYANDIIVLADSKGKITWINHKGEQVYGYTPDEYKTLLISGLRASGTEKTAEEIIEFLKKNNGVIYETQHITKDGREFPVEISARVINTKNELFFQAIIRDISERKAAEFHIQNLNRLYTVLSNINQTIVREKDLNLIFDAACKIAVQDGEFKHAWICNCNSNTSKAFTYFSAEGAYSFSENHHKLFCDESCIEGYFRNSNNRLKHIVINNLQEDSRNFPWKEEAIHYGYLSVAFFPLHSEGVLKGILGIFTNESLYFDNKELKLLDEIAMDLSYAIEVKEREHEQKRLREAELELHQLMQNIINTTPDWIFVKDRDHRFILVNKSFAENLGKTVKEIIGKFDYEVWSEEQCYGSPEKGIRGFHQDDNLVLTGQSISNPEENATDQNGNEHFFDNYKYPLYDIQGNIIGILGFARDITNRMLTDKLLRENERKFRLITENVIDAIFQLEFVPDKHFSYVSPSIETITGFRPDEFYDNPQLFENLICEEQQKVLFELKMSSEESLKTITCRIKTKAGVQIWLEIRNVPFYDNEGNLVSIEGIARDVTESKNLENELITARDKAEEMNRLKTNFLANMSHELRTPLNGILGFSEMMKQDLAGTEHGEWAEMMNANGTRLLETLDLILNLSKLESEKIEVKAEEIAPYEVLKEVYDTFEFSARKKGLKFTIETNNEFQRCLTDKRMLHEILTNLVNNAIKYTAKGSINLKIEFVRSEYIITVSDTGIGISQDKINVIFDEFRQESEGYNRTFEGTGLGLTITKRFTEHLGGTISVESTQNIGSTFILVFPLIKLKTEQRVVIQNRLESTPMELCIPADTSVLLVEDDDMNQMLVKALLASKTILRITESGIEALNMASNNQFDIILMDINLGEELNGIEITKKIRKIPGYEKIPIVALTAFALEGDKDYFLSSGCSHYLSKPFTKSDLFTLLNEIFNK